MVSLHVIANVCDLKDHPPASEGGTGTSPEGAGVLVQVLPVREEQLEALAAVVVTRQAGDAAHSCRGKAHAQARADDEGAIVGAARRGSTLAHGICAGILQALAGARAAGGHRHVDAALAGPGAAGLAAVPIACDPSARDPLARLDQRKAGRVHRQGARRTNGGCGRRHGPGGRAFTPRRHRARTAPGLLLLFLLLGLQDGCPAVCLPCLQQQLPGRAHALAPRACGAAGVSFEPMSCRRAPQEGQECCTRGGIHGLRCGSWQWLLRQRLALPVKGSI
mmetsp:Transcript_34510/g.95418  ORF Transcript_34510/g.95418 Transcript_34510/m.95418 type:complete len:278 (+) Transcript_34510:513-1346(+)